MPATSRLSQRLAADGQARQEQATRYANRAAGAVDRRVGQWWRALIRALADPLGNWQAITRLLRILPGELSVTTHTQLVRLARWARRSAVKQLVDVLPEVYRNALLFRRWPRVGSGLVRADYAEAVVRHLPETRTDHLQLSCQSGSRELMEDRSDRQEIADLIFPAPSLERTQAAMADLLARAQFRGRADLVPPERLANVVAQGMAAGKTQRQIANDLMPLVNDVRASAMRVARTWGLHVASQEMQAVHDELGDLVIGYQVHATLDKNTRSWHAKRDKQIYYLDPKPGQKGMEKCPHPPLEAEDASERPPDAPKLAWN